MVSLRSVDISLFPQIYPLLQKIDPQLSEAEWYSLFTQPWHQPEDYCGYGLFDGSTMVGFLGLIFSQRNIDGQIENFCNSTSWFIEESYRGRAISMLLSLRKLKNYTIIDLSPSERVVAISKKLGFQELDTQITALPNILGKIKINNKLKITRDFSSIQSKLNSAEKLLLEDHCFPRCHHLLAEADGKHCYIIFTIVKNTKSPYYYIQHLSNPELFARYSLAIRQGIAAIDKFSLILIDRRLLRGTKPTLCFDLPVKVCKLYKSSRLKPEQIDNLYSELIILDFDPIPAFGWREIIASLKKNYLSLNR